MRRACAHLIRLKCRLGASHPKIAENNVALTTTAIDVPQCSAGPLSIKLLCSACDVLVVKNTKGEQ